MKIVKRDAHFWLRDGDILWVSNKPSELKEDERVNKFARGDVLVGGLGLGLCIDKFLYNPMVKSITVVEKDKGVIDLITYTHTTKLLKIIHDDIYSFFDTTSGKYDFIYGDIWTSWEGKYAEYKKFLDMGRRLLRDKGTIQCWEQKRVFEKHG